MIRRRLPKEEFARLLRKNPTPAERALWGYLRKRPFGLVFNRQEVIGKWVADFYCESLKLVIEVDGQGHQHTKQKDFDREEAMAALGITTVRFSNEEILCEIEWVDDEIGRLAQRLGHRPRRFPRFAQ